jgi:archaellum component FlaG (FlaF/FlaG flagellin family)
LALIGGFGGGWYAAKASVVLAAAAAAWLALVTRFLFCPLSAAAAAVAVAVAKSLTLLAEPSDVPAVVPLTLAVLEWTDTVVGEP